MPNPNAQNPGGTVKQGSATPIRKVTAGGIAGAVTTIAVWALNAYVLPAQKPLPPEIAAAVTTVLSFMVAYMVPPAATDGIVGA